MLIKAPVVLILTVTIPVVDEDQEEEGWCQLLHGLQGYSIEFTP